MSARGLGYRLFGARAFATVEDAWPHLAPAVGVAVLFVGLSWLDLWSMVPVWAHVAGLVLFAVLLVAALWRGARGLRPASRARAVERLERDNGLRHQPLGSIEDTLPASMDDPLTRRLWRRHKEQALARLSRLRLTPPKART